MIVVTGATGQLGHIVVEKLLAHMDVRRIAVSVRDPAKAADLAARGVEVRAGDFADPAGLSAAFRGADQLLIVSANKFGDEALRMHQSAIDAARDAGVGRILYTSHMGARAGSPFGPADQHAATEAKLAENGVPWTALRHGFYAESCLLMVGAGLKSGDLRTPEDGPISWTARADLAEADAAVLASPGIYDGATPPLTATQAITMADLAAIATETTGRQIRHTIIGDHAWREERIAAGMPPMAADMLLGTFRAARRGDFAATSPTLARLLGREPTSMRAMVAAWSLANGDEIVLS